MTTYLMELEEIAKPFAIRIEGPVDAGEREGTMQALKDITSELELEKRIQEYISKNGGIEHIVNAMESTEQQDFVFGISVQGHGEYPVEPILENPDIEKYMFDCKEDIVKLSDKIDFKNSTI